MKYIDFTLPTPAENLACDEALLEFCEDGGEGEILRFWEPDTYFVVLGYANRAASEADLPACEAAGIPVYRRLSGGGTVLQGPGCLNYTLILRIPESGPLANITGANRFILERNVAALQPLVSSPLQIQGHTDLAMASMALEASNHLKFSGNAQRRKRHSLIFHGTFLFSFDIPLIAQYLRIPSKQPDYRQSRSHVDFLTNFPAGVDAIKHAMQAVWAAHELLRDVPNDRIADLARTKCSNQDWNLRL